MADKNIPQESVARKWPPGPCKRCGESCETRTKICMPCQKSKRASYLASYLNRYRKEKAAEISAQRKNYHARNPGRFAEVNRERASAWVAKNSDRHRANLAAAYKADPVRAIQRAAASKKSRRQRDLTGYRAKENARVKRRRENLKHRVSYRMSNRLWYALKWKGGGKKGRWLQYVDYTVDQLIDHLNATMPAGFSWADFMSGDLHVDHIRPIASFQYQSPKDAAFKECWALSNLQLLPALENIRKNARLDWPQESRGVGL